MPNVLLAEDEVAISEPLGIVLGTLPISVDIVSNGEEALKLCAKKHYDLILLDLMMPVCNGIEFLKKSHLGRSAPDTQVILLTNLSSGKEVADAMMLGAKQSILKADLTPSSLIKLVKTELQLS
jgi:DNA-binding response OmpR family regulator